MIIFGRITKITIMRNTFFLILFLFSFSSCGQNLTKDSLATDTIVAQDVIQGESIFDFMSKTEIFELELKADWDTLLTHKKKFADFIPGKLSINSDTEEKQTFKVSLKPRGKYRRKVCDFPPLRIKFKKKSLRKFGLSEDYNSLKLVTHCMSDKKISKQNLMREYLVYQMYNLHSEYSLRTQIVKITYVQSGTKEKLYERYGIFIEDDEELASRVDAAVIDRMGYPLDSLTVHGGTVHALFQCMIGNADWSLFNLRNVKLLRGKNENLLTILPYDFDCSGAVDAEYAVPNPDYGLTNVKQRVFLGKTYSEAEMIKAANYLLEKKDATLSLCKNFKHLPKYVRKDMVKYLKSFYKIIGSEKKLMEKLAKISPKN